GRGGQRSYRLLRERAAWICLRPWWMEPGERRRAPEARCPRHRPCPEWPRPMAGGREDKGAARQRARSSRRRYRRDKEWKVRLQTSRRALGGHYGDVRPTSGARVQTQKTGSGPGEPARSGPWWGGAPGGG